MHFLYSEITKSSLFLEGGRENEVNIAEHERNYTYSYVLSTSKEQKQNKTSNHVYNHISKKMGVVFKKSFFLKIQCRNKPKRQEVRYLTASSVLF